MRVNSPALRRGRRWRRPIPGCRRRRHLRLKHPREVSGRTGSSRRRRRRRRFGHWHGRCLKQAGELPGCRSRWRRIDGRCGWMRRRRRRGRRLRSWRCCREGWRRDTRNRGRHWRYRRSRGSRRSLEQSREFSRLGSSRRWNIPSNRWRSGRNRCGGNRRRRRRRNWRCGRRLRLWRRWREGRRRDTRNHRRPWRYRRRRRSRRSLEQSRELSRLRSNRRWNRCTATAAEVAEHGGGVGAAAGG